MNRRELPYLARRNPSASARRFTMSCWPAAWRGSSSSAPTPPSCDLRMPWSRGQGPTDCAGTAASAATAGWRSRHPSCRHDPFAPDRDEVQLPLRGKALRDKFVLRVIAIDRAVHFVVLAVI